jgi:serine/threonine protein kinase
MIGRILGGYRIIEEIGRGGMATVYRAHQESINRTAAIKVVSSQLVSDPNAFTRFQREVEIISRLEHPHILPIYDYGQVDGVPYIAMRYLSGGNLGKFVGNASLEALEKPLTQIASALDYAHEQKIIHRDLKPANILFDDKDNAYLGDFGIAHLMGSHLTTEGAIMGTPAYMSPEQITTEELEPSSDVYALGIVLFELITGHLPFEAEGSMKMLYMHVHEPFPLLKDYRVDVSEAVDTVLQKAAAKDAIDRYQSAGELARAYSESLRSAASTVIIDSYAVRKDVLDMETERIPVTTSTPSANTPPSTTVVAAPIASTTQPHYPVERNRARLLEKVEQFWIRDVLENSLHGAALLELGMERLPEAVERAWEMVLQQPDMPNRKLPHGTHISKVFDDLGGELLILGEPGSGKTTTLLELARDLLSRARVDGRLPIPVVFNLSSWADHRKPLTEWLVDELNTKYQVPRKTAAAWVGDDQISPLLDGLDEVNVKSREACVEAINSFRADHGLLPIVVCSRSADYAALTKKLKLAGAVLVQPLTLEQVNEYLTEAGKGLEAVQVLLRDDDNLQQLITTPLMLSIVALAYRGMSVEQLSALETLEERRAHVFKTYVERMLVRRGTTAPYPTERTQKYLSLLASQMLTHNITVFEIEDVQDDWLRSPLLRKLYRLLGLPVALSVALPVGITAGTVIAYLVGLAAGVAENTVWIGLFTGIGLSFLLGVSLGIGHWINPRIHSVDRLNLVFKLPSTVFGAVSGLVFGSFMGWAYAGFAGGVALGVSAALICLLALNLRHEQRVETSVHPNQGMWNTASNVGRFTLVAGTPVGILGGVLLWIMGGMKIPPLLGLLCTLVAGWTISLALGLASGGLDQIVKHLVLRLLLWIEGSAPMNYAAFLDYAASRVLLRKVGGGYLFIHRLLLVYFAEQSPSTES